MKKAVSLLLALVLALSLCAPAMADVVPIPENRNDDFLFEHINECTRVGRHFEVQSETKRCRSPQDDTELGVLSAGETVRIAFEWNGWGLVEYDANAGYGGWVDMSALRELFDSEAFHTLYGKEIVDVDGELYLETGRTVLLYDFPGSGEAADKMSAASEDDTVVSYSELWTDPQGREWGYVGDYFTHSGWVCVSDPYGEHPNIWPESAPEPAPAQSTLPTAVIVLVAAVVILTAAAIVLLTRKNRRAAAAMNRDDEKE